MRTQATTARDDIVGETELSMATPKPKPEVGKHAPGVPQQIYLQEAKARYCQRKLDLSRG